MILVVGFLVIAGYLLSVQYYEDGLSDIVNVMFTVVAVSTTTGLTTTEYHLWPSLLPYLLMFMAIVGGCGGSTSGGIKTIRLLILGKQSWREIKRLIHPKAVYTLKVGTNPIPEETLHAVWAFVSVFFALFVVIILALVATGMDFTTAFGATVASLANEGAPLGQMANGFQHANTLAKWIMIVSMFAGRFEIFTVLVLLTPEFWRR
jgi:trk system potassium uptake protein TrkH